MHLIYYLKKNGTKMISGERHAPYAGDPCFWLLPALPLLSCFPSLQKSIHSIESISWLAQKAFLGLAPGRGAAYLHAFCSWQDLSSGFCPKRVMCFRGADLGISPASGGSANLEEGSSGFLEALMLHCYTSLCFSV